MVLTATAEVSFSVICCRYTLGFAFMVNQVNVGKFIIFYGRQEAKINENTRHQTESDSICAATVALLLDNLKLSGNSPMCSFTSFHSYFPLNASLSAVGSRQCNVTANWATSRTNKKLFTHWCYITGRFTINLLYRASECLKGAYKKMKKYYHTVSWADQLPAHSHLEWMDSIWKWNLKATLSLNLKVFSINMCLFTSFYSYFHRIANFYCL